MSRCSFWFNDSDKYVSLEAEKLQEDGEYIKAYHNDELVGMFDISIIKAAYKTDEKRGENNAK